MYNYEFTSAFFWRVVKEAFCNDSNCTRSRKWPFPASQGESVCKGTPIAFVELQSRGQFSHLHVSPFVLSFASNPGIREVDSLLASLSLLKLFYFERRMVFTSQTLFLGWGLTWQGCHLVCNSLHYILYILKRGGAWGCREKNPQNCSIHTCAYAISVSYIYIYWWFQDKNRSNITNRITILNHIFLWLKISASCSPHIWGTL